MQAANDQKTNLLYVNDQKWNIIEWYVAKDDWVLSRDLPMLAIVVKLLIFELFYHFLSYNNIAMNFLNQTGLFLGHGVGV